MKKFTQYTVVGDAITIHAGRLMLADDQAQARAHALERVDGGEYEIRVPVQFKRGERFGFDGDVPKAMAVDLEAEERRARKARTPNPEIAGEGEGEGEGDELGSAERGS